MRIDHACFSRSSQQTVPARAFELTSLLSGA
jgi:hypothetical protein